MIIITKIKKIKVLMKIKMRNFKLNIKLKYNEFQNNE